MRRCSCCEFRFYSLIEEKLIGPLMVSNAKVPTCSLLPDTVITSVCITMSSSSSRVMGTELGSLCFSRQVPYYLDHLLLHSCLHCSPKYVITSVRVQRIQIPSISELLEEPFTCYRIFLLSLNYIFDFHINFPSTSFSSVQSLHRYILMVY